MAEVAIVGAGMMGSALAWPLTGNGHRVRLVGTHLDQAIIESCLAHRYHPRLRRELPERVRPYYVEQMPEALDGADLVVSGVSSAGVRWLARQLAPLLRPGATLIAVTKGLEVTASGEVRILPDVLASDLHDATQDHVSISAIGGPCIAGELAGERHSCVIFAGRDLEVLQRLRAMFATSYYHIWLSDDVRGVEICAALKNAYTLAVGLAAGMLEQAGGPDQAGAGMFNVAAALFAQSALEMTHLVTLMGGRPQNVVALPGVGDQYVTCVGGRTVRLGRLLGLGMSYAEAREAMAGETLESADVIRQLARALPTWDAQGLLGSQDVPLLRLLCRVITTDARPEIPFEAFMRDPRLGLR